MLVSLSQFQLLPTGPGIYLFLNEKGDILYIGKAKNIKKRVNSYFAKYVVLGPKTQSLVSQTFKIRSMEVASEIEAFLLEAKLIRKLRPKYNIKLTDDKSYPLIRITIKDQHPKILIARKANDKSSVYFGPFPNAASALKVTLRTIRRIFPFQSAQNHPKKICLYYHLGLCPCPPVFDSKEFRKEYKKTIKHIINFLNGNTKKIIKDLEKEREIFSKNEEFEKANVMQSKIDAIKQVTDPQYDKEFSSMPYESTRWDSNIDPNLKEDLRESELKNLVKILNQNNIEIKNAIRIECFDISNISGTNATGSMVVFTNGEKDSSWYRKFKIRRENVPNDFAMMQEVLQRRLNHNEWPMPDLIIVDGGKGQVSSGLSALRNMNKNIPLIGLAKREETIITTKLKEISLPKDSNALKLIMRIRDEAHRFAITYHRKLRSKNFLNN